MPLLAGLLWTIVSLWDNVALSRSVIDINDRPRRKELTSFPWNHSSFNSSTISGDLPFEKLSNLGVDALSCLHGPSSPVNISAGVLSDMAIHALNVGEPSSLKMMP